VISGTIIALASRYLEDPWRNIATIVAPTVSVVWAWFQAMIFDALDRASERRDEADKRRTINTLKEGVSDLKALVQTIAEGPGRTKLQQEADELEHAIAREQIDFIRGLLNNQTTVKSEASSSSRARDSSRKPGLRVKRDPALQNKVQRSQNKVQRSQRSR
jgi:hypothetical protein